MKVLGFRLARWNALLNHTQIRLLKQMPAITAIPPNVMFGGGDIGGSGYVGQGVFSW